MIKQLLISSLLFISSNSLAKEFNINIIGDKVKENITLKLDFKVDEDGKLLSKQKYDVRNLDKITSLKVITASGLLGTLKDERELIVYYKTNLNIGGLKIRNLYKTAIVRIYNDDTNLSMTFDKDHYQNIISYLRYHNIKQELINDIDNMYGTWEEIDD